MTGWRKRQITDDDDTQGFLPDWANFNEGRAAGRVEAFTEIADKIKAMPFGGDTIDSLIIWLEEQK